MISRSIIESVIDPEQASLSKYVFSDNRLLPSIRFKILRVWGKINRIGPTSHVLIVGSIGTLNYSAESDVDVTIKWLGTLADLKTAQQLAISMSGKEFAGPHEINYFLRPDIPPDYFDAIYDVVSDRWIKGPSEVSVDIDRYMQRFEEVVSAITIDKAELLSDLADYRALDHATSVDRERAKQAAEKKLEEIEKDINSLGDQYLEIRASRKTMETEDDLDRIREYGRRNALPENVIYLLLRRYCYLHFLHTIYEISDDGVQKSELDSVEDAFENFGTCKKARGFEESLAISLGSID